MRPEEIVFNDLRENGAATIQVLSGRIRSLKTVDLSNTLRRLAAQGRIDVEREESAEGRVKLTYRAK